MVGLKPDEAWVVLVEAVDAPPGEAWLGEGERRRMAGMPPGRARQYQWGRRLLRLLLARATGYGPECFAFPAEGPPVPQGPPGLLIPQVTLTHSGDFIAAAAGREPLGLDVERRGTRRDWAGLGRHLGLPEPWDEPTILRAWTRREARFKAGETGPWSLWRFGDRRFEACLALKAGVSPRWVGEDGGPIPGPDFRPGEP